MKSIESKLAIADKVLTVSQILSIGFANEFISRQQAAGIYKDVLKGVGFIEAEKATKPATAPVEEK